MPLENYLVDYPFAIPFAYPMRHLTPKMHTEGERKCEKMQNAEANASSQGVL